jgi:hypothetical protein
MTTLPNKSNWKFVSSAGENERLSCQLLNILFFHVLFLESRGQDTECIERATSVSNLGEVWQHRIIQNSAHAANWDLLGTSITTSAVLWLVVDTALVDVIVVLTQEPDKTALAPILTP